MLHFLLAQVSASEDRINEIKRALEENAKSRADIVGGELGSGGVGEGTDANAIVDWWSLALMPTLVVAILVFSLLIALFMFRLLRSEYRYPVDQILRLFGTLFILTSVLVLVVAGYTKDQMAPAMGLLGTIAGYLLGKSDTVRPQETKAKPLKPANHSADESAPNNIDKPPT